MATAGLHVDLGAVTLRSMSVSAMDNICYLLTAASGEQVLVDAADEATALLSWIQAVQPVSAGGPLLDMVITTHAHWDHTRALAAVLKETGAPAYAGAADVPSIPVPGIHPLVGGERLEAGPIALEVIALRGHTPGSVALVLREDRLAPHPGRAHIFTGDSLFPGGLGNTDNVPERFAQLFADVTTRIFRQYHDDTVIYPGHGAPTTLGAERPQLAQWWQRGW